MAPTRVLIFGATGGCGKHALSNLLDRGVQCVAVVRSEERLPAGCKGKSNLDIVVVPDGHLSMDDGAFAALVDGADAVDLALDLIKGGGARLNDVAISDEDHALGEADFIDGRAKISAGKKRHALLVIA